MKLNKKLIGIISLGALALIGGTFAYYTATNSLDNPFTTGRYDNVLYEEYSIPGDDVKPGAQISKEVSAKNTGDYPVLVRISMQEDWYRATTSDAGKLVVDEDAYKSISSKNGWFNYADDKYDETTGVFKATQIDDTDGKTPGNSVDTYNADDDGTVIYKILDTGDADTEDTWVLMDDGYWYWNSILDKGETTDALLNSLVVATNIDLGEYETTNYYMVSDPDTELNYDVVLDKEKGSDGEGWHEETEDTDLIDIANGLVGNQTLYRMSKSSITENLGYADSEYVLTVTSQFVQANKDAVADAWFGDDSGDADDDELSSYDKVIGALKGISLD